MAIPDTALGMNAGSVSRALAPAVAHDREERAFRLSRLALARRLADIEANDSPKKVRWWYLVPIPCPARSGKRRSRVSHRCQVSPSQLAGARRVHLN